ncbi:MAG: endonuclease/exonuclease/phosphatase family protein [Bacteroidales bacterium]|nr:endonuclease/exonuclease/phosphatase family protein [Bacteroidales bacterium]
MRKCFRYMIVAALSLLPQLALGQSSELKVMSYNIRQGSVDDGTNSWMYRCPATIEMLEDQKPDIMGLQEALCDQVMFIEEFTKDYDYVGVGREDGKKKGEHMAIFWNKKTIKLLKWGTFWLSETPEKPSMGWDAACYRTATWALMKDKRTGEKFYFVNTHLDHVGAEARKNGLKLIVDRIGQINPEGYPMILTGDFNMKPTAPELKELDSKMKSTRKVASKTDNHNTFNEWGKAKKDMIIDYIYISDFTCLEYSTITKKYAEKTYISDHYPISARLIF